MNTLKWKALLLAAAITSGGLFTMPSHAVERPGLRSNLLQRAKQKLDLTEKQVAQIKEVLKTERDTLRNFLSQLREARTNLRSAIRDADATEASVRVAAAKVAAIEADLAVERLVLYGKLSPILTDEQREKLSHIRARFGEPLDSDE